PVVPSATKDANSMKGGPNAMGDPAGCSPERRADGPRLSGPGNGRDDDVTPRSAPVGPPEVRQVRIRVEPRRRGEWIVTDSSQCTSLFDAEHNGSRDDAPRSPQV